MATVESVSDAIINMIERDGSLTLSELEKHLGVSYNLIFLAIDKMVVRHLLILQRQGVDYILSRAA